MDDDGNTPAGDFKDRLRYYRDRAGMSRGVFGQLCGHSEEWVKALESGRIKMPRVAMLIHMAGILEIRSLEKLTGVDKLTTASYGKRQHEHATKIGNALANYPIILGDREPLSAEALAANVRQAWMVWHGSPQHRTAIAAVLPRLLDDARVSTRLLEGRDRRSALASLAQVYHLAQLYFSFQPQHELVMLTGDRSMIAAQEADDPYAIAAAVWYMNHVYRDAAINAEARIDLAHQATRLLRPEYSEEDRSLWGLMHLAIALSHAKTGRRGDAERHWDLAYNAAQAVPGHHPWLMFGQSMVEAYAITMYADLVIVSEAVRQAERISLASMPSHTRRSFHTIEIARAYHLKNEPIGAVHLLNKAHAIAPETIEYNLFTRSAVLELAATGGATVRDDARELALKLQLPFSG